MSFSASVNRHIKLALNHQTTLQPFEIGDPDTNVCIEARAVLLLFFRLLKPIKSNANRRGESDGKGYRQNLNVLMRYGMPLYLSTLLAGFIPLYQNIVPAFFHFKR
jgi:hypothetical protein